MKSAEVENKWRCRDIRCRILILLKSDKDTHMFEELIESAAQKEKFRDAATSAPSFALQTENSFCVIWLKINDTAHQYISDHLSMS